MLKVKIILGTDEVTLEGLPFCEVVELLKLFLAGRDASATSGNSLKTIAELVQRGAAANTALRAAVAAAAPDPTGGAHPIFSGDVPMLDFSSLEAEVAEQETADASAATLLNSLFAEVEANKTNPVMLQKLVDRGRAATSALAAAVTANTPAAVPPATSPVPGPTGPPPDPTAPPPTE